MEQNRTHRAGLRASLLAVASLAALTAGPRPAFAGESEDITAIRAEMEAMKRDYDARIKALETRLEQAESTANAATAAGPVAATGPRPALSSGPQPAIASGPQPPAGPQPPLSVAPQPAIASGPQPAAPAPVSVAASSAPQPSGGRAPIGANAYNPGVSVVLNGTYAAFEHDPDAAAIPGFQLGEEAGLDSRGFSLGESEIAIDANIDHRVHGVLIFALTDEGEVEVEEAYIQTTRLPGGFTARAGEFFSGVGYLNEKHDHAWDFIDAPLPYRAFLGRQLGDAGVQVRWIAPTDFFLEAGGEILRGDSFPAAGAANKGAGAYSGFVQTGGDIGSSSSWLAKASYLHTKAEERDVDGDIFSGTDDLAILSLVYKWAPNGNPIVRNLIVNGEFFYNNESGDFNGTPIDLDRTGWYAQAVYQFRPHWRVGARYARLGSEAVPAMLAGSAIDDLGRSPDAISTMLEFDTSEFSRFRLMYTYDDTDLMSNNELLLRYTVTFGPHGAHRF